uniref:Uncharacterized protein n=1 Tax=Acrobeloides nanus TaxID=290746 RepID=A0A914E7I4_9BILA
MVVISCSDEIIRRFISVEQELFLKITHLTLQVHVNKGQFENVAKLLSVLQKSHTTLEINLELHAPDANLITSQLNEFYDLNLKKIKIICYCVQRMVPFNRWYYTTFTTSIKNATHQFMYNS